MKTSLITLVLCGALASPLAMAGADVQQISHGRFENVRVYPPENDVRHVAMYLSPMSGWSEADTARALQLQQQNNLVIGVDSQQFFAALAKEDAGDECEFTDGDLENLSHYVQALGKLPAYHLPVLVGRDSAAGLAYGTLAQAPAETFAGALTENFCPHIDAPKMLCNTEALVTKTAGSNRFDISPADHLNGVWVNVATHAEKCDGAVFSRVGEFQPFSPGVDPTVALATAARQLESRLTEVKPSSQSLLEGLPLEEVLASSAASAPTDVMAIFLSGDGGWAGIDKDVADVLAAKGISVVGWDSLRYFWTPRTPDGLAEDANRIIRFYLERWHKKRVIVMGYSQGANVLPFLLNRLADDVKPKVSAAVMMGLEAQADFEFHLSNWVADTEGRPVRPEINRLAGIKTLCVFGEDEEDSLCPDLPAARIIPLRMAGGHHFDGDYKVLAGRILVALGMQP